VRSEVLNHDVPCRWCLKSVCPQQHHRCLRDVEPPQVLEAALRLLASAGPPGETRAEYRPAPEPAADPPLAGGWSFL
jgi:hypothetical protein